MLGFLFHGVECPLLVFAISQDMDADAEYRSTNSFVLGGIS